MNLNFSNERIRKFLLYKQLLLSPREISGDEGIAVVFNSLRSLQYDPQNPCGRNIDLSLQARVKNINPSQYHNWLYQERKGIEIYDKELCVVPIEDLVLCKGRFSPSRERKLVDFITSNRTRLDGLIEYIKIHGPICSSDIGDEEKVDIFWEPTRWSKVALDSLWKRGELVITYRKKSRKYFDLPDKVYGEQFSPEVNSDENELLKEQVKRRIASVGLLSKSGTGSGWLGVGTGKEIIPVLDQLMDEGKVLYINVEGSSSTYVINSNDFTLLDGVEELPFERKVSFLPPLDNLLWDRKLVKEVFGFDYKWEAYTPKELRKFGHYVLPILYGTDFIGRIEPTHILKDNSLKIKGFWLEDNQNWDDEINKAFFDYLDEFKTYLGAESIDWLCEKPELNKKV